MSANEQMNEGFAKSPGGGQGQRDANDDPRNAPGAAAQEPNQAELAVMHPDGDDPEWRYYFGAWHS
jgi:hypothetical protein